MSDKKERPTNKNLKPFKKGKSGNPKGKKKGCKNLKTRAIEILAAMSDDGEYSTPICNAIIKVLENEEGTAKPSEVIKAGEFLRDAIEGKPTQKIEQTNEDVTKRDLSKLTEKELNLMDKIEGKLDQE